MYDSYGNVDPTVVAAIIGASGVVVAAVVGALLGRSGFIDKLFGVGRSLRLLGQWDSRWHSNRTGDHREMLFISRQRGARLSGYITHENEPDKKWNFDGNFSGQYLQMMYYPAPDSKNRLFQDYGCYFLKLQPNGEFEGFSVGVDMDSGLIESDHHGIRQVR